MAIVLFDCDQIIVTAACNGEISMWRRDGAKIGAFAESRWSLDVQEVSPWRYEHRAPLAVRATGSSRGQRLQNIDEADLSGQGHGQEQTNPRLAQPRSLPYLTPVL